MYSLISRLILYKIPDDSILASLARIIRELEGLQAEEENRSGHEGFISEIYGQINSLLHLATDYGFEGNLWHNYLAYILAMSENPFSLSCEMSGAKAGSINSFAKKDFRIFKALFDYDFAPLERKLGIDCFSIISNYQPVEKAAATTRALARRLGF